MQMCEDTWECVEVMCAHNHASRMPVHVQMHAETTLSQYDQILQFLLYQRLPGSSAVLHLKRMQISSKVQWSASSLPRENYTLQSPFTPPLFSKVRLTTKPLSNYAQCTCIPSLTLPEKPLEKSVEDF